MINNLARKGLALMKPVDTMKYSWVQVVVVGTLFVLNIMVEIEASSLVVGDPQDWLIHPGLTLSNLAYKDRIWDTFFQL